MSVCGLPFHSFLLTQFRSSVLLSKLPLCPEGARAVQPPGESWCGTVGL